MHLPTPDQTVLNSQDGQVRTPGAAEARALLHHAHRHRLRHGRRPHPPLAGEDQRVYQEQGQCVQS